MQQFTTTRRRELPADTSNAHPGANTVTVEIKLWAPSGANPDDVSRVLTSALVDVAETFGDSYKERVA